MDSYTALSIRALNYFLNVLRNSVCMCQQWYPGSGTQAVSHQPEMAWEQASTYYELHCEYPLSS